MSAVDLCRADILDMVAEHAGDDDPRALVTLLDELRELALMRMDDAGILRAPPRTKRGSAEIEADVLLTARALGYLRETWPKPYQELVRSGPHTDARRAAARDRLQAHKVTVSEYMTKRDALHARLESLGVDLVLPQHDERPTVRMTPVRPAKEG